MKKAKQRQTELDEIVTQLHAILHRETSDVVLAGNLLLKSRGLFANEHGEWLPWLVENFDLSQRTAQRYIAAAEYVTQQKRHAVSHFSNLSPTVLYALAAGRYSAEEEAAILTATHKGRVDQARAQALCEELVPPEIPEEPDQPDEVVDEAAEDAEAAAILDGPPPAVPPPAPVLGPPNFMLRKFDLAISALKQIMTKPAARFASTSHRTTDLENVESFIHAVADRARAQARADRAAEADVEANES